MFQFYRLIRSRLREVRYNHGEYLHSSNQDFSDSFDKSIISDPFVNRVDLDILLPDNAPLQKMIVTMTYHPGDLLNVHLAVDQLRNSGLSMT
jgi:hypothetical protein